MNVQEIGALIGQYGFPVVMCGVLCWYVKHMTDKFQESIDNIRKQHDEESKGMIKSLDANTAAINLLSERLKE